jgi:hypothetical protein
MARSRPGLGILALASLLLLGALALPACPKMKKRQEYNAMLWTVEVNDNVERIYQALERHHRMAKNKETYRFPSAGPTPAHIPCGKTPHAPDEKLWSGGWKEIGFSLGERFRYRYQILSTGVGPTAGFTIRAHGDLDCDGVQSTYERQGTLDGRGQVKDGLLTWDKAKELE